ncbi:MAG: hypothetical protein ABIA93_07915 [Candidatus Woesearchaeota archaeon]
MTEHEGQELVYRITRKTGEIQEGSSRSTFQYFMERRPQSGQENVTPLGESLRFSNRAFMLYDIAQDLTSRLAEQPGLEWTVEYFEVPALEPEETAKTKSRAEMYRRAIQVFVTGTQGE